MIFVGEIIVPCQEVPSFFWSLVLPGYFSVEEVSLSFTVTV